MKHALLLILSLISIHSWSIYNGVKVPDDFLKSTVKIGFYNPYLSKSSVNNIDPEPISFCTAQKLSDSFFITAAHCLARNVRLDLRESITSMEIILTRDFEKLEDLRVRGTISEVYFSTDAIYKKAKSMRPRVMIGAKSNDMVIIKILTDDQEASNLPNAIWDRQEISRLSGSTKKQIKNQGHFLIAGYGLSESGSEDGTFELRSYVPNLIKRLPSDTISFKAQESSKPSVQKIGSGDSGGGLWLKTDQPEDNFLLGICYGTGLSIVKTFEKIVTFNGKNINDISRCATLEGKEKWISDVLSSQIAPHWQASI